MAGEGNEDGFNREALVKELESTQPLGLFRWVLEWPVLSMLLTSLGPTLLISIAVFQPVRIDTTIESFRIRDHPVAKIEDALHGAKEQTAASWEGLLQVNENEKKNHLRRLQFQPGGLQAVESHTENDRPTLNIYQHLYQKGQNGSGWEEDTQQPAQGITSDSRRLLESAPRRLRSRWQIHVLYTMQNESSIWTPLAMKWIQKFEQKVMSYPSYHKMCLHYRDNQGDRVCRPPNSVINYVFPSTMLTDTGPKLLYDGNGKEMGSLFNVGLKMARQNQLFLMDGEADLINGAVNSLRSDFLFGLPEYINMHETEKLLQVDGYASVDDNFHEQEALYKEFIKDLYKLFRTASDNDIRVNYGGEFLTDYEIKQELFHDCTKIGWGIAAIMLFAWWHTQSLFITAVGILEIVASLPVAYFFQRVVLQIPTVNVLQFLGLFIILGIGIDDVFVFFDTYLETLQLHHEFCPVVRLSHAYRRAGAAMAVTSFTSAAAFMANIISAIPAVRSFGIFLATMIAVNYILVMTWFPACVCFWEKYSVYYKSEKSSLLRSLILGTKPKHYSQENSLRKKAMKFWRMHSWVIHKARWVLLVALTAIAGVGMYTMAQLKGSNSVPALFPDGHNIQTFLDLWESRFLSSKSCDHCWKSFEAPYTGDISPEYLSSFTSFGPQSDLGSNISLSETMPSSMASSGLVDPELLTDNRTDELLYISSNDLDVNTSLHSTGSPPPGIQWLSPPPPPDPHPQNTLSRLLENALQAKIATFPVTAFVLDMKNSRDVYWVEEYRGMNTSHAITGLTAGEIFEFRLSAVSGPYKVNGAPIAVTISSMEIPPKPSNVRMIKRTPYSIRIKWDHTDAGRKNPIDGYTISVCATFGPFSRATYRVDAEQSSIILGPLKDSSSYNITVSSFNEHGESASEEQVLHTRAFPNRISSSGYRTWSRHLQREVRMSLIDATEAWEPAITPVLVPGPTRMIYVIIPTSTKDKSFPLPESIEGSGGLWASLKTGSGKSLRVAKLEERIISMYMKHAKKSTQIQPVVITTVEQLPDDNAGLLSKWLTKDLVTVMDSMHGIFERADRAVVGVGTGGIAALKAGVSTESPFSSLSFIEDGSKAMVVHEGVPYLDPPAGLFVFSPEKYQIGNVLPCHSLKDSKTYRMLKRSKQCNILEHKVEDIFSSGVQAFDFIDNVFSVKNESDLVIDPPPQLNTAQVSLVWGIESVDINLGGDPFARSAGDPIYAKDFDITLEESQRWILHVCDTIHNNSELIQAPGRCFMKSFKEWLESKQKPPKKNPAFPVPRDKMLKKLWKFMEIYKPVFGQDVGYVVEDLESLSSIKKRDLKPKWIRVTAKAKVGNRAPSNEAYTEWKKWDQAIAHFNEAAPPSIGNMKQTSELWVRIWTEREIVDSTKWAIIIAGLCALMSIIVFTGNLWIVIFALVNLVCILCVMLGFFHLIGWKIGALEAISITMLVGLSVDFILHISEAYSKSVCATPSNRAMEAIQRMGSPVVAAAITTIIACMPLVTATILVLKFFGIVVASSIALSVVFGLYFLAPMLMVMGPRKCAHTMSSFGWIGRLLCCIFGTSLRRATVLTSLMMGILACFKAGQNIIVQQIWLLCVVVLLVMMLTAVELHKIYGKCLKAGNANLIECELGEVKRIKFHSYSGGVNFDAQSDQVDGHSPSIHLRAHRGNQSLSFSNCEGRGPELSVESGNDDSEIFPEAGMGQEIEKSPVVLPGSVDSSKTEA